MDSLLNSLYALAEKNWPFVAWLVLAMVFGQVMKSSVWTKERATQKGRWQPLFWWMYRTLPLHPMLSGALVGLAWPNPIETIDSRIASAIYFALAGACSVFAYEVIKSFAKKQGIDLHMPGENDEPPKA
jgi:hypothetical protein